MSVSTATVPEIGEIHIRRARGVRSVRLRVNAEGSIYLTLPWWVAKSTGLAFARRHREWILEQQQHHSLNITSGMSLYSGQTVMINRNDSKRSSTKTAEQSITLTIPKQLDESSAVAQKKMKQMLNKVLKVQSEEMLLPFLQTEAENHGFIYKSAQMRNLKSRWGSCNEKKEITLNIYLVQLPKHLIEYVLLHELTHTKHLHHGKDFWAELMRVCPDSKQRKKELKQYQPRIYDKSELTS